MVYSTDPITDEFMTGAKTLLDGVFAQDWPDVADKALDVVQVLMNKIIGSSSIQTGGNGQSMMIPAVESTEAKEGHGKMISAAFTEVEECSAQEWLTETNFYLSYYAFVVWEPSPRQLAAINATALVDTRG